MAFSIIKSMDRQCKPGALSPPLSSTPWYEAISLPAGWSFYTMVSSIATLHFLYVPLPLGNTPANCYLQ